MASTNLNFDKDVLPVIRGYAKVAFARDNDRPTKTADAVSRAWEFFRAASGKATAKGIATYAIRHVKAGRHFQQSERSLTGPKSRGKAIKALRVEFDLELVASVSDNPARLAALRVDFPAWFGEVLNDRQREICTAFIRGDSNAEVAEQFGITVGRVSQLRRWLVENWLAFTA